jgi:hypothetical protein
MVHAISLPKGFFMKGFGAHMIFLLFALPGTAALYAAVSPEQDTRLLYWYVISITIPVLHQLVVWFCWRLQLTHAFLTRIFGKYDLTVWGAVFLPLLAMRMISLVIVGSLDSNSITSIIQRPLLMVTAARWLLIFACMLPAAYGIWSVIRYFGLIRALGADHFRSEYRSMPLETRGAYRFSDNVMYSMVFLLFWAPALILDSPLALISASFQHAYIWVHYYCTEEPDMRVIYGS